MTEQAEKLKRISQVRAVLAETSRLLHIGMAGKPDLQGNDAIVSEWDPPVTEGKRGFTKEATQPILAEIDTAVLILTKMMTGKEKEITRDDGLVMEDLGRRWEDVTSIFRAIAAEHMFYHGRKEDAYAEHFKGLKGSQGLLATMDAHTENLQNTGREYKALAKEAHSIGYANGNSAATFVGRNTPGSSFSNAR